MLNNKLDKPLTSVAKDGDYGFGIRGVVAIAPADGQYKPHGLARVIKDVSYLLIQGGHDQDLSSLAGIRQYNRVKFEANPDAFKAVAYVYRANHGNFSSVWAANDHGPSASMLLNRAGLLAGEEQQMAARVFMTAFLETTLRGKNEYRQVFVTPARARDWLPEDVYITQYDDASYQAVNTHERAGKLERIDMAEGKATTLGMTPPFKQALTLRDGLSQNNTALRAAWDARANPSYTLGLPQGSNSDIMLTGEERLVFDLANLMEDQTPLFVTVELLDAKGKVAVLPVSRFGVLPPPVPAKLQKSKAISNLLGSDFFPKVNSPYERVLQSYEIPLSAFVAVNMDFDPQHIKMIRFRFNDEMSGKVYVDQVGFRG